MIGTGQHGPGGRFRHLDPGAIFFHRESPEMSLRRAAASHESAHCIVAWALGYAVSWAWVNDERGQMAYAAPQSERDETIILLAGTIAQLRVCPDSPLGRSDARRLAALPAARYRAEAEALVTRHWSLIADVASRLLERGEVGGIEVTQVCMGLQAQWCS
jgi:hypothetical protein